MKILSIGNFGTGWDGSICDEEHIAGALTELGHEVVRLQREDFRKSYKLAESGDYDFVLLAQWDGYGFDWLEVLRHGMVAYAKKIVPIVYWAFDYQNDGQEWHEYLVKHAHLYLSKRIADSKYPNWQWLSQDFAPNFLDKVSHSVTKDIDVLFTGSYLDWATERNEVLEIVDRRFNLVIHSVNEWPGFKDQRGPIMDEGLPELYARARIVLSIDHTIEAGYWSDRISQAMACGAFVLHRYQPLSEARFGYGIDYFYSPLDCMKKINYWLGNKEHRNLKAKNGYAYAQVNLMVRTRVQDLLTIVKNIL